MSTARYVLITPVRNEAEHISHTLDSVLAQTTRPQRWVIVSDGSTDATDEIVRRYAEENSLIRFLRREPDPNRNFGSKVRAIQCGLERLADVEYEYIGNLDGDVAFTPEYFEKLFDQFESDPKLGIGGGLIHEMIAGRWTPAVMSPTWSVSGAVQMFRRECFDQVGGYIPLPYGGVDAVAEGMARMHGWRVRTFTDLPVHHYGRVGAVGRSVLRAFYDKGRREYVIGYHPVFGAVRSISRMRAAPFVVGGLSYAAGFYGAVLQRRKPAVPPEYVRFLRREQLRRLFGGGTR